MWCVYLLRRVRSLFLLSLSSCSFVWLTGHCPHYINQYVFSGLRIFFSTLSLFLSFAFDSKFQVSFVYKKKRTHYLFSSDADFFLFFYATTYVFVRCRQFFVIWMIICLYSTRFSLSLVSSCAWASRLKFHLHQSSTFRFERCLVFHGKKNIN